MQYNATAWIVDTNNLTSQSRQGEDNTPSENRGLENNYPEIIIQA